MRTEHRDILISKILNSPPFQLPPVIHVNGCFSLDIQYLGKPLVKIGYCLEECLQAYWDHVSKVNWETTKRKEPLTELPIRLGANMERP
jgi:hypothetical protein